MSDGFQYGDLIFLGLVALFIALRLRSMLGRNSGIDPREMWKQASKGAEKVINFPIKTPDRAENAAPATDPVLGAMDPDSAVVQAIRNLQKTDTAFTATDFVQGAKLAFEWLVNAFSKGNKDALRALLSDERYQHFVAEIDNRAAQGITQQTTLVSIQSADITEVVMNGSIARVTVQFTSEQIHVQRDATGTLVAGDINAIENVVDIWTFERDISSRDPNWRVIAT